jgi:phosphate transport system substrate-binding protein
MIKLSKDATLLLKGLIIGKVLTLVVIGGLLWWLWSRLEVERNIASSEDSNNTLISLKSQTVTNVPVGSFNYGGSPAWAPIRQIVDAQIQAVHPELQLRYVQPTNASPGDTSGIRMLLDRQLDIAHSARPLTEQEKTIAKQQGFNLQEYPVAIDGVAVVVNPSLDLPGLTVKQLRQIYRGEITNWSEVGGADLSIVPFALPPEDVDPGIFATNNSNSPTELFGTNVQYAYSTTEALRQVSATPGGIYYGSAKTVVPQCSVKPLPLGQNGNDFIPPYRNSLVPPQQCPSSRNEVNIEAFEDGSYPLTRELYVIVREDGTQAQQAGKAYAEILRTQSGQQAIAQAGFASLNYSMEAISENSSQSVGIVE